VLDIASDKGVVLGGTGRWPVSRHADVMPDAEGNSHWDGTYGFD
jgi:hypothetical protein